MNIDIDMGRLTFVNWMTFAMLMRDGKTGDAIKILDNYIIDWDYDVDVSKGLRGLPNVLEVNKCLKRVMSMIQGKVDELGVNDVIVDLSHWTFDDYEKWEKARFNKNWILAEKMMHKVAKLKDTGNDKDLNCVDGLRMASAIVEVYQQSFLEAS